MIKSEGVAGTPTFAASWPQMRCGLRTPDLAAAICGAGSLVEDYTLNL